MLDSTSMFEVVRILYKDGSFAIARGIWDGESRRIGMRWYEKDGIGYPQTYGKPQWFILPSIFTPFISKLHKDLKTKSLLNKLASYMK